MTKHDKTFSKDASLSPPIAHKVNLDGFILSLAGTFVLIFFTGTMNRMHHRIGIEKSKMEIVEKYSSDVDKLRKTICGEISRLNLLKSRKADPGEFGNVYALLTKRLPDQSWLLSLTYQSEQVDLVGVTFNTEAISDRLKTLPWRTQISFLEAGALPTPVPAEGSLFLAKIDLGSAAGQAHDSSGCTNQLVEPLN